MSGLIVVKSQVIHKAASVDAVIAVVADRGEPMVLDSADFGPSRGRFTIVACDPVEVVSCRTGQPDPFETLRGKLAETCLGTRITGDERAEIGFPCGWMGYFAYEAGRYIEKLPATTSADVGLSLARFALYDSVAVYDAHTHQWTAVAADLGVHGSGLSVDERIAKWSDLIRRAQLRKSLEPLPSLEAIHNMTCSEYKQMVYRAKEYIAAGDIFQVNLARRESFPVIEPAVDTYLRLRQANPGAYAAFMRWADPSEDESAILSSSPELFLQLNGREILTRPIKGTRPRVHDPVSNSAYQMELAASEKDRAELAMIVDLERNDIGRVCEYGSVRVVPPENSPAQPYELETHPTVHHLVANVVGRMRENCDTIDLVRACFPGGSITGAPKVRAMEIIDELEPTERSVYTGSIGYFGLDGSMMLNIAIRTMIMANEQLHIYAGGGIVADSDPDAEFEETQAKASGLRRALGITSDRQMNEALKNP